jgi:hypothetical protein
MPSTWSMIWSASPAGNGTTYSRALPSSDGTGGDPRGPSRVRARWWPAARARSAGVIPEARRYTTTTTTGSWSPPGSWR